MLEGAYQLTPQQLDVFRAALGAGTQAERTIAKTVLANAGIRGGKTQVGALITLIRAMNFPTRHDECHAVVSPTFPMSKLGPEPKLLELLGDKKLFPRCPLIRHAKSERCLYLASRGGVSRIRIFSAENPDRFRGDRWLSCWWDEADYMDAYAWRVGQGRLADSDGPNLITTTPKGHNIAYEIYQECSIPIPRPDYSMARSEDGRLIYVHWASTLNAFVSLTGLRDLAKGYDADTFDQEVNARFVASSGRVYKAFDRERNVMERPFRKDDMVLIGQDFNVARMSSALCQVVPPDGLHVFEEFELRDSNTHELVQHTLNWAKAQGIDPRRIQFIPDASSQKDTTNSTKSDRKILEEAFDVDAMSSNPLVRDRVNCVNGLFYNRRLSISSKCKKLIEAVEKQPWDPKKDPPAPAKDGILDNRTDGVGYVCWKKYPLRRATTMSPRRAA